MILMAKKKHTAPANDKKAIVLSYRPHPEILSCLERYRSSQRYLPTYSQVFDEALVKFLRAEGFDVPDITPEEK